MDGASVMKSSFAVLCRASIVLYGAPTWNIQIKKYRKMLISLQTKMLLQFHCKSADMIQIDILIQKRYEIYECTHHAEGKTNVQECEIKARIRCNHTEVVDMNI